MADLKQKTWLDRWVANNMPSREQMAESRWIRVFGRLGPRILRTETAGLAALATLQSMAGDFR